jgi:hypothetical protein
MKTLRFALGSTLFLALFATASIAQNARTYVSGAGVDGHPCSLTSPCRTFTRAISQTNAGGQVIALSTGEYEPFSINKAITVEAPAGVYAGITVTSGDGIDINAGQMDTVILRGLTVNNQGSTDSGIVFSAGGTLHIESCIVNGFSNGDGIAIFAPGNVFVTNTIARGNDFGILVDITAAGTASVAMDQLHLDANVFSGLGVETFAAGAVVNAAIHNSSASGSAFGMTVDGESGGVASLYAESCLIANNGQGLAAQAPSGGTATAFISNCAITCNAAAGFFIQAPGAGTAAIYSRGQNTLIGNGPNTGALTALAGQ